MECSTVRHLIDDGVVPSSAEAQRAILGFHLASCTSCREYRTRTEQMRLLQSLLVQPVSAPPIVLKPKRHSSAGRRLAGATLLLGALALVPYIQAGTAVAAVASPAPAAVAVAQVARGDDWHLVARQSSTVDAVLLKSLLDTQFARADARAARTARVAAEAQRANAALLESLLGDGTSMAHEWAAVRDAKIAQVVLTPGTEIVLPTVENTAPDQQAKTYVVVSGDSLWKIAEKFYGDGTYWGVIFEANAGKIANPNLIYPNQSFTIPVKPAAPISVPAPAPATPNRAIAVSNYTIVSGDTLSDIAYRYYGNGNMWPTIFKANPQLGSNPNLIFPGQVVALP